MFHSPMNNSLSFSFGGKPQSQRISPPPPTYAFQRTLHSRLRFGFRMSHCARLRNIHKADSIGRGRGGGGLYTCLRDGRLIFTRRLWNIGWVRITGWQEEKAIKCVQFQGDIEQSLDILYFLFYFFLVPHFLHLHSSLPTHHAALHPICEGLGPHGGITRVHARHSRSQVSQLFFLRNESDACSWTIFFFFKTLTKEEKGQTKTSATD